MVALSSHALVSFCLAFDWQAHAAKPWAFRAFAWLRSFGRLSYEMYLTHMFVVFAVVRAFKARGGDLRWGILWYLPGLCLSFLLGALVARYLSIPSERVLREKLLARKTHAPSS